MASDKGPSNDDVLGWTAMFIVCLLILGALELTGVINIW